MLIDVSPYTMFQIVDALNVIGATSFELGKGVLKASPVVKEGLVRQGLQVKEIYTSVGYSNVIA